MRSIVSIATRAVLQYSVLILFPDFPACQCVLWNLSCRGLGDLRTPRKDVVEIPRSPSPSLPQPSPPSFEFIMRTFRRTQLDADLTIRSTMPLDVDPDMPCKADLLSTAESINHMSACPSPPSPITDISPNSSDSEDSFEDEVIIIHLLAIACLRSSCF